MLRRILIGAVVAAMLALSGRGFASVIAGQAAGEDAAIRELIAARQRAWNAGDAEAYARLLTPDADLLSSSGGAAETRDGIIRLYKEQRTGVFAGATTAMRVVKIRMVRPDVALVDAERTLDGLKTEAVADRSRTAFVVVKQADGRWLITAQRAGPQTAAPR